MSQRTTNAQHEVQRLIDQAVADGGESGIQVAAYLDGELVVDAWAAPSALAVDGRSLFPFFSTGKGIAATAIHRLVERGVFSWDDPISRYWPEFAANGKEGITLRHALSHTAGLPMMPERCESLGADWNAMCEFLAASAPLHPPGARRHYHAITYTWLLGETARRAYGRDFGRIIFEEVCAPLGLDTLFFGLPVGAHLPCIDAEKARPSPASGSTNAQPADPVAQRAIPPWVCPLEDWINREDVRRACMPSSNGFGNARALACHYAALVGKGLNGVRLLSPSTVAGALRWNPAVDGALPGTGRWSLGYSLEGPDDAPGAVFGHGGYGGSTAFADLRHNLAVAVVKSRMGGSIAGRIVETIRRCVGAA